MTELVIPTNLTQYKHMTSVRQEQVKLTQLEVLGAEGSNVIE